MSPYPKYRSCTAPEIADRIWPTRRIVAPPVWCAVDLRDGNQAFARPMDVETKTAYFRLLTAIGFKEIEIGYPSASRAEFDFVRRVVAENLAPDDVEVSVFTAMRRDLIERTFEAIEGIRRGIVHCYIATSELHRRFVFDKSREEIVRLAVEGTEMVLEAAERHGVRERIRFEFSPEEFSDTETDFAVEIACAVRERWGFAGKRDFILNLPHTVERRAPYEYADRIEAFVRKYPYMDETVVSVHTHNDQGCAVAAAEMALLAGAERVEGTLLGHGERTGNMDLVTMALNFRSRGVDPGLDFSDLPQVTAFVEGVSGIAVNPRQPYAGELVYTAFSGTHQDAIRKGLARREEISEFFRQGWKMPYLPLDPADVGRDYDGLIRINSQSGKGGIAYILEQVYGIAVPKELQPEVARAVQRRAEASGGELTPSEVREVVVREFELAAFRSA